MRLILRGIDPGIVDTGLVTLDFDFTRRSLRATGQVWTGVSTRKGRSLQVSETFLKEIRTATLPEDNPEILSYLYIEGFRNRGRDTYQDQTMSHLIQEIHKACKNSNVIDNTGVKKVVTPHLLSLLKVNRWPRTNHSDLLSASRIALKGAIENPDLNKILASMVVEQHREKTWEITTTTR